MMGSAAARQTAVVRRATWRRLDLLGNWRLVAGGTEVACPVNARRLLALLALTGPRPRRFLAGTLWPECSEANALGSLRATLSRAAGLRDVIRVDGETVALADDVEVDVDALTAAANQVLRDPRYQSVAALDVLIADELLPGWYDDWVLLRRERLRQLRLHALETLAERLSASGRYAEAVDAGLAAVEIEPLRESSHRCLIDAHLQEGNRVEALRQFRIYRDLLSTELSIEPSLTLMERLGSLLPAAR